MTLEHTLSDEDQIICKELANERYESNRKSGVRDQKIGKQSNEFVDLQGVSGEFAFCRIFDVEPDTSIYPRNAKRDKGDTVLDDGTVVDVKTTHYPNGKLLVVPWKVANSKADYYGLMVGAFPTYEFKGFIHRDDMLQSKRLKNLGYGDTFAALQSELQMDILNVNIQT